MAQQVLVILEDDIDGGKADETITFAFMGAGYEIDLTKDNADKLRAAFAPYLERARKTSSKKKSYSKASGDGMTAKVREWAIQNGYETSERGRVSGKLREAYEEAHTEVDDSDS